MKTTTKQLAMLGILLALNIILSRLLSVSTEVVKFDFAFIPIVIAAMMYGPIHAGILGALGDFVGAIVFPIGPYFPGFTLSAALAGIILGIFLYKKRITLKRVILAVVTSLVVQSLVLDTIWLKLMYEYTWDVLIPLRLIKIAVIVPIEIIVIYFITKNRSFIKAIKRA